MGLNTQQQIPAQAQQSNISPALVPVHMDRSIPTQQAQEPLLFFEGSFIGFMPVNSGVTQAGKQWNRTLFKFKGDNGFEKDFKTFTPLPGKTTLQAEQLVNGARYKVGYVQKQYFDQEAQENRKSNTVIFVNESTAQALVQQPVAQPQQQVQQPMQPQVPQQPTTQGPLPPKPLTPQEQSIGDTNQFTEAEWGPLAGHHGIPEWRAKEILGLLKNK